MNYILTEVSNQNCYLIGNLTESGNYICDTLQFGNINRLKPGTYMIKIGYVGEKIGRVLTILDYNHNIVAYMNFDNFLFLKNIRTRINNSNIITCVMGNDYLPRMQSSLDKLIISQVVNDNERGIDSTLTIIEPQFITDNIELIETITNY